MGDRRMREGARDADRVVRTFLFSDIVRSTDMRSRFIEEWGQHQGNEKFREAVLGPHDERVEKCVSAHGGQIVSTAGDSYFVTFTDARKAIECAVAFQRFLMNRVFVITVYEPSLEHFESDFKTRRRS